MVPSETEKLTLGAPQVHDETTPGRGWGAAVTSNAESKVLAMAGEGR